MLHDNLPELVPFDIDYYTNLNARFRQKAKNILTKNVKHHWSEMNDLATKYGGLDKRTIKVIEKWKYSVALLAFVQKLIDNKSPG